MMSLLKRLQEIDERQNARPRPTRDEEAEIVEFIRERLPEELLPYFEHTDRWSMFAYAIRDLEERARVHENYHGYLGSLVLGSRQNQILYTFRVWDPKRTIATIKRKLRKIKNQEEK